MLIVQTEMHNRVSESHCAGHLNFGPCTDATAPPDGQFDIFGGHTPSAGDTAINRAKRHLERGKSGFPDAKTTPKVVQNVGIRKH